MNILLYIINLLTIGTLKDFVKYDKEYPGVAKNILEGMKSGRLKFSPVASPGAERRMQQNLRRLFAEKRHKHHCETFLNKSISNSSRRINGDGMQILLDGLRDGWSRSFSSKIGVSGKADATRVRSSVPFENPVP